jgi:hypothetical protein
MKVEFFSSKKEIIEGWRFNASYSAFFPFGKNSKKESKNVFCTQRILIWPIKLAWKKIGIKKAQPFSSAN